MPESSPTERVSPIVREELRITRHVERGSPGDHSIFSDNKTPERKELARKKSQFYGEVFASREPSTSSREIVARESMIMADVRTNVIIQDEYTFITDLSYALSTRYQRSQKSIVVTITHSCCMLFGGNFAPAYSLTITALGSQLQPVTNKRNAALLSKTMEEGLGVPPQRGIIRFSAIAEENLSIDGKTVAGEIEELEKGTGELQRSVPSGAVKSGRHQSTKSLRTKKISSQIPNHTERPSPTLPMSECHTPAVPPLPTEKSAMDRKANKAQKMGRKKSFIATIFKKAE